MTSVWGPAGLLARRELRAGLRSGFRGFRIFILCLALGVASISGVSGLSQSVVGGLEGEGRRLLGGDVDLRLLHRPADEEQTAWLEANSTAHSRTVEMRAMASPGDGSRAMIELKAVDAAYPLVGTVITEPPLDPAHDLGKRDGAWGAFAEPALLRKLGLSVGERVKVGETWFEVRATVTHEPDRVATVLSFGPRFMVGLGALEETGLVQPGSQIRYHHRLALPPGTAPQAWTEILEAAFPEAGWRVRTPDNAAPGIERFVERMSLFLGFVGLVVLLVGGIGVGNAVRSYLDGETATIATLKCVGATGGLVFRAYFLQIMTLASLGVGAGLAVGAAAPFIGAWALAGALPVAPIAEIHGGSLGLAALFGLLTAGTFALWPLARAREVPAAALFRDRVAPADVAIRRGYALLAGSGIAVLAALTIVTAAERGFAYWFVGGTLLTLLLLRGGAALTIRLARRLHPAGAVWRLALTGLFRPGNTTGAVMLSLGTGLTVLVAVALIQGNMNRQIEERLPDEAPAFFFIDIQDHQGRDFDATVTGVDGTSDFRRVASLRGRIVEIDGKPVEEVAVDPGVSWAVRGDRALTYSVHPPEGAEIVAGEWWAEDYSGPPIISFDARVAKGFGVGLGDTLTLNVLGRDITATITSLREIDWRSLRFDFAIIFAPGTLEGAPHTHIAAVRAPREREDAIERAVGERFTNVTAIRVREALEAAANLLAGIGGAIQGTAAVTLLAGALVLGGTVAATRRRRVYEAVVYKVLGATRKQVLAAFLLEYGVLGLATAVFALGVGSLIAWAVIVFLMGSPWVFLPGVAVTTAASCLGVTVLAGFIGTWRVLGRKAAGYLRNE